MFIKSVLALAIFTVVHFSSETYSSLAQSVSQTYPDSVYYASVGHVGTIGDSLGDSLIVGVPLNQYMYKSGGQMLVSFQPDVVSDTLCDSIIVKQNDAVILRQKVNKTTPTFVPFNLSATARTMTGQPEKITFIPKWKLKAGKGAHTLRMVLGNITQ